MKGEVRCYAPPELLADVNEVMFRAAGPGWEDVPEIATTALGAQSAHDSGAVAKVVSFNVGRRVPVDMLFVGDIRYSGSPTPSPLCTVRNYLSPTELARDLGIMLERNRLDLCSRVAEEKVSTWEPTKTGREAIVSWLEQFSRFGDFRWIGERLLLGLKCLSTSDLVDRLVGDNPDDVNQICYFAPAKDPAGSASALANAISKRTPLRVTRLDAGVGLPETETWMFVEDCSISGQEFVRFLNVHWPDTAAQPNTKSLRIRFGVISNGAEAVIRREIASRNLVNFHLDGSRAFQVETVTPTGVRALTSKTFYADDGSTVSPQDFLAHELFRDQRIWGSRERARVAKRFLAKIGFQLYQQALADEKKRAPITVIKQAGLGAGGLGLALTLARSVPRSTLPVFWASGLVSYKNVRFPWTPLFRH